MMDIISNKVFHKSICSKMSKIPVTIPFAYHFVLNSKKNCSKGNRVVSGRRLDGLPSFSLPAHF